MLQNASEPETAMVYCSCEGGFQESRNPRISSCVRCGRNQEPLTTLPEHVEDLFEVFATVAEGAGAKTQESFPGDYDAEFEAFKEWMLARVRWGQATHGEKWRNRHMPREACEELLDCCVYAFAQMVKDGERSGDLLDAATHVYRAFLSFRRYEARKKGSA